MPGEILREQPTGSEPVLWRSVKLPAGARWHNNTAQTDLERARRLEQARRDGFASGVAAAKQEGDQQLLPAVQELAAAVSEVARLRDRLRENATNDVVHLAIAIASRVIHRDVAVEPDVLAGLLRAAFSKLQAQETARARIHPEFEPILRRCVQANPPAAAHLVLLPDHSLEPGALILELDGVSDASAEADLGEIERGLSDKLGE